MCGRFTLKTNPETLTETFPGFTTPAADEMAPRYNIAPSQQVAVVPNNGDDSVEFFQWGLIPSWAKDPKIGNRMINARVLRRWRRNPRFGHPISGAGALSFPMDFMSGRLNRGARPKPRSISASNRRNRLPSRDCGRRGPRI